MNKIKVCHVLCGLCAGGVESVVYNYCSHMNQSKYEWHLLYQHEPSQKNVDEFEKLGFKLRRIPKKAKHPIKNYKATYKYLKDNEIEIVHCHMTLMNFIPLMAAKKLGIKVRICHSHNSDARNKNIFKKVFEMICKKLSISYATELVACGEDAGKYMYGNRKFLILNNALDLKKFQYNIAMREKIRKQYHIDEEKIIIGHIGRFTEQKNHEFLLDVFEKVAKLNNKYILMLIGDGERRDFIEKKINELNIKDKVILTGIVNNTNEFYSAFDMFVLPSIWEGLPVVGIEAQIAGLPCLFANKIDENVIIDKEKSRLLELQQERWISEINSLADKIKERDINMHEFEERNLNIEREIQKLEELYAKNR